MHARPRRTDELTKIVAIGLTRRFVLTNVSRAKKGMQLQFHSRHMADDYKMCNLWKCAKSAMRGLLSRLECTKKSISVVEGAYNTPCTDAIVSWLQWLANITAPFSTSSRLRRLVFAFFVGSFCTTRILAMPLVAVNNCAFKFKFRLIKQQRAIKPLISC